jgi:hypothetical protein
MIGLLPDLRFRMQPSCACSSLTNSGSPLGGLFFRGNSFFGSRGQKLVSFWLDQFGTLMDKK